MKTIKFLSLFLFAILVGCNGMEKEEAETEEMAEDIRDPAEVNKEWLDAWNSNDPNKLQQLTDSDAVLYMEGIDYKMDSIKVWYKNSAPVMKDLKTKPELTYSNDSIAYEVGTYTHMMKNDSLNTPHDGTYTLIWHRANNDWKLKFMNITEKDVDSVAASQ